VRFAVGDPLQEPVEVMAREGPLERAGDLAVVVAEGEQSLAERVRRVEVVGGQRLALDDREVRLELVQPGRVDRQVDQPRALVLALYPRDRGLAGV
jgi:hypothetical protein